MSLIAAAFVTIAQSGVPAVSDAPRVVQSATASARIIRPATIRVRQKRGEVQIDAKSDHRPQRRRDAIGTVWIEFN